MLDIPVRFYKWAKSELEIERNNKFPLLSHIQNPVVLKYLDFYKKLSEADRGEFIGALLKGYHQEAAAKVGENLTDKEKLIREEFFKLGSSSKYVDEIYMRSMNFEKYETENDSKNIDKKKLTAELVPKLSDLLGPVVEKNPGFWTHRKGVRDFSIETNVDVGGKSHSLKYFHSVTNTYGTKIFSGVSILQWFGILPATYWIQLRQIDLNPIVECFPKICERFISFVETEMK